jgi:adenine-specific DNA-methyltransferase
MPFEITRTELVWPGKYDEHGKRPPVEQAKLPFQVIERVNESRATREAEKTRNPTLFDIWEGDTAETFEDGWRNKLIWGDNKLVMSSLLDQFAGKVDLIYIDPPFAVGSDFSFLALVGDGSTEVFKEQSVIEEKAYRDTWGSGIESYLQMIGERFHLIRELLSEDGALFVHCDWRMNSYIRTILDEVFGRDSFRNEIIWRRAPNLGRQAAASQLGRVIDTIFSYTKQPRSSFAGPPPMKSVAVEVDKNGKPKGARWDEMQEAYFTTAPRGDYTDVSIEKLRAQNRVYQSSTGSLSIKYFLRKGDDKKWYKDSRLDTLWDDHDVRPLRHRPKEEDQGFDTQKPEGLLERIVSWASMPGDLVADFFCGSGTTLAVAEKLGRRWIGADLGRYAVHTTRKRLLGIPGCKPFEVLNLGKYERQYWQVATFGEDLDQDGVITLYEYIAFILKLYGASPAAGMQHLHGRAGPAFVHVGAVDSPVTIDEITSCVEECVALHGKELHVLGWEWEMGLHDPMTEQAAASGVKLVLRQIPREVMEQQAVDKGDVAFFELAYLDVEVKPAKRKVVAKLKDFMIPNPELVPDDVRAKITKWSDYVDYWAVDWNFSEDTFMQGWVTYRTRKDRSLDLESDPHTYEERGEYAVMVKVIDIFGNDTSTIVRVKVD